MLLHRPEKDKEDIYDEQHYVSQVLTSQVITNGVSHTHYKIYGMQSAQSVSCFGFFWRGLQPSSIYHHKIYEELMPLILRRVKKDVEKKVVRQSRTNTQTWKGND